MIKKVIVAGLLTLTLCSGVMAADNGAILSQEEGNVNTFMTALNSTNGYESAKGAFSKDLKGKVTADAFSELQKQVKSQFGTQKELKLFSLEKFDQGDRLTYIASYGDNKIVRIVIVFGPDGRGGIQNFAFTPIQDGQTAPKK